MLCSHHEKRPYLKRNRPKYDDAKNKKEKSTKKRQQSPQKETTAKRKQPKRAARFNEEIIVVVGWRWGYLRDLHAEFAARLTRNSSIECNKCQGSFYLKCANMTRSYFTCQYCDSHADFTSDAEQLFFILLHSFFMAKAFVINKPTINTWNLAFRLHFFQPILNFAYCLNLRDKYFGNQKSCVQKFAHNFFFAKHFKYFF